MLRFLRECEILEDRAVDRHSPSKWVIAAVGYCMSGERPSAAHVRELRKGGRRCPIPCPWGTRTRPQTGVPEDRERGRQSINTIRGGRMKRDLYSRPFSWRTSSVYVLCVCVLGILVGASVMLSPTATRPGRSLTRLPPGMEWLKAEPVQFTSTLVAFRAWDAGVGCTAFRERVRPRNRSVFLQDPNPVACSEMQLKHVAVLVKEAEWFPENINNLYSCGCGMSCLWGTSAELIDRPDALFYETSNPPPSRKVGEPLRVFIELESHKRAGIQDIFVSYHHEDNLQATYAGASFHTNRNYHISTTKTTDALVYWSSSRCVKERQQIARQFLPLVPHHSFGRCLNNMGGADALDNLYPKCRTGGGDGRWSSNLHCGMSHYKFVLAIENTFRDSYVTEKLFYALDVGSVPIYFGAPNVLELVPPNSIIVGTDFASMEDLAAFVKRLANDPVRYAGYHAWRRCGELGNYLYTRAVSLDSLPCRLCATVSKMGGRNAPAAS